MASEAGPASARDGGRRGLGAIVPAALLGIFAGLAACFPITNTDIWWHLLSGRTILESGIPSVDPFTIHAQGQPWVDLHWGFQLGAFFLFNLGGTTALVIAKCLIFALGAWLLLRSVEAGQGSAVRPLVVLVLIIIIAAGRPYVFARPVVLSLLLLSACLLLLERFLAAGDWRWLIGLPVVQVLWVNVQPLHVLGPAVLVITLAGEGLALFLTRRGFPGFAARADARQIGALAICLGAVVLAGLANPYGLDAYRLPLGLLTRIDPTGLDPYTWQVSENVPAWQLARTGDPAAGALTWIAATTFASFLLGWRRISLTRLGLAGAFFALALMANRNILLFIWIAAPVIAANVSGPLRDHWSRHPKGLSVRLLGSLAPALVAAVCLGAGLVQTAFGADLSKPAPFRVPEGSARVLATSGRSGPVFCAVRHGGYLAWRLFPRFQPYIDGRLVLTTPSSFASYLAAIEHPEGFERLHGRHEFAAVVLPVAMPDRYQPLVRHLLAHPGWRLAYTDGTETLFVPRPAPGFDEVALERPPRVKRILDSLAARFDIDSPELERARIHLGLLLALADQHDQADELLDGIEGNAAQTVRARNLLLADRPRQAEAVCLELLEADPAHPGCLKVLARVAAQRGDLREAVEYAARSLDADPFDLEARALLEAIGDPQAGRRPQRGGDDD